MRLKYFGIIIFASGLILFTGCSSSSNSTRYSENNNNDDEHPSVRYSSDNDLINDTSTSEFIDENDTDDIPDEESSVDISNLMERYNANTTESDDFSVDRSTSKEKLLMEVIKFLNTPYKYGGTTKDGIDCSAFTQSVFSDVFSYSLSRTARDQYTQGEIISSRNDLEFGDIVFFNTRKRVKPGHVGIYLGDNLFAHASSKNGVIVSSIDHGYYLKRFMGGRRIYGLFDENPF